MWRVVLPALSLVLGGCSNISRVLPPEQTTAVALAATPAFAELKSLPIPKGRIPVSVYSFRDQTGQYKPQENVSSFSTAVTQGANSILMQALHETDWFL